jgi:manganese efflux pump family protein
MEIAALILWIITAAGGFYLLATWIGKGGTRQQGANGSKFPPALIFGHFLLAVLGLISWIIYMVTDSDGWAWTALVLLLVIAVLGFTMLLRWLPCYRARAAGAGTATSTDAGAAGAAGDLPAEQHFPVAVVVLHGLFAVTTLVLVLLTALEVGS